MRTGSLRESRLRRMRVLRAALAVTWVNVASACCCGAGAPTPRPDGKTGAPTQTASKTPPPPPAATAHAGPGPFHCEVSGDYCQEWPTAPADVKHFTDMAKRLGQTCSNGPCSRADAIAKCATPQGHETAYYYDKLLRSLRDVKQKYCSGPDQVLTPLP